jgi:hypothetical protein
LFFKKSSFTDTFRELEDVVASKVKKEFTQKELENMVAAHSSRFLKESITKSVREDSSSSELDVGPAKEKKPQDEEVA